MDRREFFIKLSALAGYALVPVGCGDSPNNAANSSENTSSNTVAYSRAAFSETVNSTFSVEHDIYGVIDLMMEQVDDELVSPNVEQFSVSLTGPQTPVLAEGTYNVYNDTFGSFSLYLQNGVAQGSKQSYRAVFSLLNA